MVSARPAPWAIVAGIVACLFAAASVQAQPADTTGQWLLPEGGQLNGSKAEIEDKPCCTASSRTPVQITDAAVLAKLPGVASRDGGVLRLKLADNRTFKLADCIDGPACEDYRFRTHRLVAWWPAQHYYVVAVQLIEGAVGYLISERDGSTLETTAPAVLSPSGRIAVALTSDLMQGVELQWIDLSRTPPALAKIEEYPKCAGSTQDSFLRPKPVWVDDTHVRFEGKSPNPDDKPNTKQLLKIDGGKTAWEC
jgi:hypothetical protein